MVKPISLRLRNAEILAKSRATLIRGGRGDELKRAHTARVMRQARATVARAKEQNRLKAVAALAAQKAIVAVRAAYQAQEKVAACRPARHTDPVTCSIRSNLTLPGPSRNPAAEII
jgi:hypothetical protein